MLNNDTYRKYKIHIHTTLDVRRSPKTVKEILLSRRRLNKNNEFICHSIDNLTQIIINVLKNPFCHQLQCAQNTANEKFQWLLNYMKTLLVTSRYQYYDHKASVSTETIDIDTDKTRNQERMSHIS